MGRLRIVTQEFTARLFDPGSPLEPMAFAVDDRLVFLRHDEEGWTYFAKAEDIPQDQPSPRERLPEYLVGTDTFDNSTRPA